MPTTYLITPPFDVSWISGSVPMRPTSVMRASCEVRVLENARYSDGVVEALRRIGESRNDMLADVG